MPPFAVAGFLTAVSTLSLALFAFFRSKQSNLTKLFFFYSLSIAEWSFFTALHSTVSSEQLSFFSAKAMHVGVFFIPILFFHFVLETLSLVSSYKNKLNFGYFICFVFLALNFATPLIVPRVVPKLGYLFFMDGGFFYPILIFYFVAYAIYGLMLLMRSYSTSRGNRRNQLKYLFLGSSVGYVFGISCFLPVYNVTVFPYPYGSFAIVIYVVIMAYAIFKYRLMDMTVFTIRGISFLLVYCFVLGIPFWIGFQFLGKGPWVVPISIMAIFATAGPFLYNYIRHRAEEVAMKDQRRYQQTLLHVSRSMTLIKDLNQLLKLIVHVVTRTIKINNAFLFLLDKETNIYSLKASRYQNENLNKKIFDSENPIVKQLLLTKTALVYDELKSSLHHDAKDANIRNIECLMEELEIAVIVPSFVKDFLIGFLALSDKKDGRMYTHDDLNVFGVLANQSALAIENAIFYREQGKTLAEKFHEHKVWSIGKMGSGVGHQINNRFQSLVYAADAARMIYLPKIKNNLTTPEALASMQDLEEALQTFSNEAVHGSEIAVALTNFSRKSQDFKAVDLEQVVKGALNLLSCKFRTEELHLQIQGPQTKVMLLGNLAILQDIFMNIFDNAHDAQTMRRQKIEKGELPSADAFVSRTQIRTELDARQSTWVIDIEDNGIGMTEEELNQMFIPFFTTKATTEKGTGLGMSIIKQMVDAHKGTINIFSKYGEGTKIRLTLPKASENTERID